MKVIGKKNEAVYIAEVSHQELEKFMNTYYNGGTSKMEPGQEIDLAKGYDHAEKISNSVRKMEEMVNSCEEITEAIKIGKIVKKRTQPK